MTDKSDRSDTSDSNPNLNQAAAALGLASIVGSAIDSEAPLLPLSTAEPPPVSSLDPKSVCADTKLISGALQRLANNSSDPESSLRALSAAVQGEAYDANALPSVRAIALGICRAIVKSGVPADALCQLIMDAAHE